MRTVVLGLAILFCSCWSYGQREAANWYFGKDAGLNFNSGTPEVLLDGLINTVEGCESFSDGNGNLLFYTDGKTVWNKLHEVMPNGTELKGSFSTSQAALVVPHPIDKNIYYIFTPDDALTQRNGNTTTNGFNYSVVDMSLQSGYGDVSQKNVTLLSQCSEKVTGIRNSQDGSYWVITQFRNQFYAYRVDANGVNTTPVISTTGPWIDNFENIRGTLKVSPDGTKIAITHTIIEPEFTGSFYLFDFDVNTGIVSNEQLVSSSRLYYGAEFSSDSSKLYGSGFDLDTKDGDVVLGPLQIVQFDLEEANWQNSEYVVDTFLNSQDVFVAGALQLGIDKKIYHTFPSEKLSVMRTPNLKGIDVDFRPFSVDLGGRLATYGLPPFIQSFFETIVTIENFCEGSITTFTTESTGDIVSIDWNFGDPGSGVANTSSLLNPTHVFSTYGVFTVTMNVNYTNGSSRQFIEFVEIAETPDVISEVDLVQCDVDGVEDGLTIFNLNQAITLFNNDNPDITALFFSNEADAMSKTNTIDPQAYSNSVNGEVIYARAFENAECAAIVKINLIVAPMTNLGVYDTVYICDGFITGLGANINTTEVFDRLSQDFPNTDVTLFRNEQDALLEQEEVPLGDLGFGPFDPYPYELYFRVEEANNCAFIGKALLDINEQPIYEEQVQVNLCNGQALLEGIEGYQSYLWSNGMEGPSITVESPGFVDVVFGSGPCLYTQTFEILPELAVGVTDIVVEDFSKNNSIEVLLDPEEDGSLVQYSIDNGTTFQEAARFTNLDPGVYDVVVDNGCNRFAKMVMVGGVPAFFTPNNDGANDLLSLKNPEFFPSYQMTVFNRYGKLLRRFTASESGWDGRYGADEMPPDDYWYVLELENGRVVKGYFTLKR